VAFQSQAYSVPLTGCWSSSEWNFVDEYIVKKVYTRNSTKTRWHCPRWL